METAGRIGWGPVLGCAFSRERQSVETCIYYQSTRTSEGVGEPLSTCLVLLVGDRKFRKELMLRSDLFRSEPIRFLRLDGLSLFGETLLVSKIAESDEPTPSSCV